MTKHTQQLVLMLIVGALIGFAIVKVFSATSFHSEDVDDSTPIGANAPTSEELMKKSESLSPARSFPLPPSVPNNTRIGLSVLDQAASTRVSVAIVAVESSSWVAVYDQVNGVPGSILGASKVKQGETSAVIDLLRPEGTLPGATYYVAILPDNGDGEFNRLTDLPPFVPEKLSIVTFKAQ
jgi:hypothetical protein